MSTYAWGRVIGRVVRSRAGNVAATLPDLIPGAVPASGLVIFTPTERLVRTLDGSLVEHSVSTAKLDETGAIVDADGKPGIWLVSGNYDVTFELKGALLPGFPVAVTANHTATAPLNLSEVAPFTPAEADVVTTLLVPSGAFDDAALSWRDGRATWLPGGAFAESHALASASSAEAASASESLAASAASSASTSASEAATSATTASGAASDASTSASIAAATAAAFAASATPTLILDEGAPIPAGTPVKTLIARKSSTVLAMNRVTNPSFETAGAPVEVWRNHQTDPRLTSTLAYSGPTGVTRRIAVAEGLRCEWDTAQASPAVYQTNSIPTAAGARWSSAVEVTVPAGSPAVTAALKVYSYGAGSYVAVGPDTLIASGTTVRLEAPSTVDTVAGVTGVRAIIYFNSVPAGTSVIVGKWVTTASPFPLPYFDGATSSDSDLTPSWTGTPNASPSILSGVGLSNIAAYNGVIIRSSQWAAHGAYSARLISRSSTVLCYATVVGTRKTGIVTRRQSGVLNWSTASNGNGQGKIYFNTNITPAYVSEAAPNAPGAYTLRAHKADTGTLVLYGGQMPGESIWWDGLVLTDDDYSGPYFDGSTAPATPNHRHAWTGAPHASTSTLTRVDNYVEVLTATPSTTERLSGGYALANHAHADLAPLAHKHTRADVSGLLDIVGAGRPDIPATMTAETAALVAAASSGTTFRSTDGPQGAWEWRKRGTVWSVTDGDTGNRNVTASLLNGWLAIHPSYGPYLRRIGSHVTLTTKSAGLDGGAAANGIFLTVPPGFAPGSGTTANYRNTGFYLASSGGAAVAVSHSYSGGIFSLAAKMPVGRADGEVAWVADDAWPTVLPGTAA